MFGREQFKVIVAYYLACRVVHEFAKQGIDMQVTMFVACVLDEYRQWGVVDYVL